MKLATEKPELAKELVELATKHDFEFSDEVSDEELDGVAGGLLSINELSLKALNEAFHDASSDLAAAAEEMEASQAAKSNLRDQLSDLRSS
jgi:hypothetical protein